MVLSPCPQKERCGSCGWSHIPYPAQLEQKLADINGSFKLHNLALECTQILPSPKTSHYRNRMDFVINFEGFVGLREKGKWWRVIDNHPCFISDERIESLFSGVRDWVKSCGLSYFDRKANTGLLRYAVIRSTSLGETMVTIITSAQADEDGAIKARFIELAQAINPTTLIWGVNHTISDVSFADQLIPISGNGSITEQVLDYRYVITPNAFFQTNSSASPLLLKTVIEFCGDAKDKVLLDLYCGSGFFSIALANTCKRTVGVELIKEAIADARQNALLNNVSVEYIDAKAEDFSWKDLNPDILVLDPPRSGMHDKALDEVIQNKPAQIVFVSCNYKHFAHAMTKLDAHYEVRQMRAIDMFPHTPHVELVSSLQRR